MTVTGPFDMNAEYKDFKFHAYTDFYDMDRTTAVNNKEGYVVVVPIMSSDEKPIAILNSIRTILYRTFCLHLMTFPVILSSSMQIFLQCTTYYALSTA